MRGTSERAPGEQFINYLRAESIIESFDQFESLKLKSIDHTVNTQIHVRVIDTYNENIHLIQTRQYDADAPDQLVSESLLGCLSMGIRAVNNVIFTSNSCTPLQNKDVKELERIFNKDKLLVQERKYSIIIV